MTYFEKEKLGNNEPAKKEPQPIERLEPRHYKNTKLKNFQNFMVDTIFEKEDKSEDIELSKEEPQSVKKTEPKYHKEPEHHQEFEHHKNARLNAFQKFMVAAMVIQILLLLFVTYKISNLSSSQGGVNAPDVPNTNPSNNNRPSIPLADESKLIDDDAVKGDKNAPVTIIEFSDYECPFCERFWKQTLPQIEEKYIKTGKVKLIYRDFPLGFHANAQKAAEAAECAGEQDKYYEMHDKLFELGVSGGAIAFKQYAKDIGLDAAKFSQCLDSGKMGAEVQKDSADGQSLGVSGTPAFFINGQEVTGAQPFSVFEQIIEAELKK